LICVKRFAEAGANGSLAAVRLRAETGKRYAASRQTTHYTPGELSQIKEPAPRL
jgi:hypothetical protein